MMTEANITRLVSKLSQMRGAALKLGQLMSIPGMHSSLIIFLFLSVPARSSLTRDARHLHSPSWCRQHLPPRPGQRTLHARLANATSASNIPGRNNGPITLYPSSGGGGGGQRVAVKIRFPNIASSIASDLGYVKMLLTAGSLLPRGLFLDRTIQVCALKSHPVVFDFSRSCPPWIPTASCIKIEGSERRTR
jgi:aarF domain-containing kinase